MWFVFVEAGGRRSFEVGQSTRSEFVGAGIRDLGRSLELWQHPLGTFDPETNMHLAQFILHDMESILANWEAFVATLLPAATGMTSLALRDDAQRILEAVAKDLATPQTREAQSEKS
jgi:hypothetical protein